MSDKRTRWTAKTLSVAAVVLAVAAGLQLTGRSSRELRRAVEAERSRGAVKEARVYAGAAVTRRALVNMAMLTSCEESLIQMAPLGEPRYKVIVDAYAMYAVYEVGQT